MQPDLAAPGTYILAAWPPYVPISRVDEDDRKVPYNILSGTSMACPHASAAAAYVKSFHPTWSPAAIKSSLMTTGKRLLTFTGLLFIPISEVKNKLLLSSKYF